MVAGCGATCVKYLFFTFNFLIFICGGAILGVSLWARFDANFQSKLQEMTQQVDKNVQTSAYIGNIQNMYIALYVLAAIGGLLLLCGFLGCCGACCENTCLLGTFFFIILVLFLAEIAGGIYIFVKKDDMRDDMRKAFRDSFITNTNQEAKNQLKDIQEKGQCCGAAGCDPTVGGQDLTDSTVIQCCATRRTAEGCSDKLFDLLKSNVTIVAIVAVCLVVVELLAMIFSCILCNSIRNSSYQYY